MALARDNVGCVNIVLVSPVLVLLLLAVLTTAADRVAKVQTWKEGADCEGTPTSTFSLRSHTCHTFPEQQGAIRVSNISDTTLVTYYNRNMSCKASNVVFEGPGPGCLSDTHKTLSGLFIQS